MDEALEDALEKRASVDASGERQVSADEDQDCHPGFSEEEWVEDSELPPLKRRRASDPSEEHRMYVGGVWDRQLEKVAQKTDILMLIKRMDRFRLGAK